MKVFLDANVIISVLNKEYPLFTYSSRLLSLSDSKKFDLYTSALCLAIAFYFSTKKSGEVLAKKKIKLLAEKLSISNITQKEVDPSLSHSFVHDIEDGFQYYSAINAGCQCIVTENVNDFYFAEIEILDCHSFLNQHVF